MSNLNSVLVDETEDALRIHEKPRVVPAGCMQRWEEVRHPSLHQEIWDMLPALVNFLQPVHQSS